MSSITRPTWIGQCQVRVHPGHDIPWAGNAQDGRSYVVIQADTQNEFEAALLTSLEELHLDLTGLEEVEPLLQHFARQGMSRPLVELAQQLNDDNRVVFGRFEPVNRGPLQAGNAETIDTQCRQESDSSITHLPPPPLGSEVEWGSLLQSDAEPLWAIVDGVNWPEIQSLLSEHLPPHACLYSTQDVQSQAIAPWLVRLEPDNPITYIVQARPQDSHALILFQSEVRLKALRDHFRLFTLVWTPADEQAPIYFRFYDPRVLTDLFSALDPWKQTRFCAPVSAFYVPLSPWLRVPEWAKLDQPLPLTAALDSYQQRLLKLAPADNLPDNVITGSRGFRITAKEFEQFGFLNACRQQNSLAITLHQHYAERCSMDDYLRYAALAPKLGKQFDCHSTKHVKTLAQCLVLLGEHFPQNYPQALTFLKDKHKSAHERIEGLWQWVPQGLLLQKLESVYEQQVGHESNDNDQTMEDLFSPLKGGTQ